jgi:hypothetical protein
MANKVAACINDSVVVNVAVYDETLSAEWLKVVKKEFDEVLIVDNAGIGWLLENGELVAPPEPEESSD